MYCTKLCRRCDGLTAAAWIEVSRKNSRILPEKIFFAIENRQHSSYNQDERDFRAAWPSEEILNLSAVEGNEENVDIWVHKSLASLREAAILSECHLCHLVYVQLQNQLRRLEKSPPAYVHAIPTFYTRTVDQFSGEYSEGTQVLIFYFVAQKPSRMPEFAIVLLDLARLRNFGSYNSSVNGNRLVDIPDETLVRLRAWMDHCRANHSGCVGTKFCVGDGQKGRRRTKEQQRLPTRLLQIRDNRDEPSVRLVETSKLDLAEPPSYACLSHCWGPRGLVTKLVPGNYAEWLLKVPFEHLSRTFKEAILVTRALGIEFLWIDALCIIQDSPDWALEATAMSAVFSQGLVTFAASASSDSEGGLIIQEFRSPCMLSFSSYGKQGPEGQWQVTQSRRIADEWLEMAPLNRRAWVFQERLLSPRTIHFTSLEILWQCGEVLEAETLFYGDTLRAEPPSNRQPNLHRSLTYLNGDWTTLVNTYSKLNLTYPKDKLAALAGVAEAFCEYHGWQPSDYCAGLWSSGDLKHQLLWDSLASNHDEGVKRELTGAAPSWSWASQGAEVIMYSADSFKHTEWHHGLSILSVELDLNGSSPFSLVQGGVLRLRTVLLHATQNNGSHFVIRGDDRIGTTMELKRKGSIAQFILLEATAQDWSEGSTYALPMASGPDPSPKGKGSFYEFYFLIVRPSPTEPGRFQRIDRVVGSAVITAKPGTFSWWSQGCELDPSLYRRAHGRGVYEIEIV